MAYQGQGLKEEATADLYSALNIEPNNKRAKVHYFICLSIIIKNHQF